LAETKDIKQLAIILTIVASIIALALGIWMSSQMSGTIKYILRQLRKVAKGDLTVQLKSKSKDEFGMLCEGVNNTVEHVKELIVHVNEVSIQLNDAATYVSEASGTFMETSHDIQNAVSEIEVGVNRLDSGSADCLNQMDSLSGKIANVSTNADEIGKLTSSTGATINNGIESVQGLTDSAESTTKITQSVIVAIEELEQKSKSIGKITAAINEIAEQTNLLSLNASIEAARAGEAGKGFAVVAEEIRKLSDQCMKSSTQINNIVNEIVAKTRDVVAIAKEAETVVSSQAGAVEETTYSFRLIDQQVEHLLLALATISSNVQEMNSSRTETLEAIESISAVSAETAACSTSVYSTAGTQLDAVQDLDKASHQLRQRADMLVEILGTFTV
jgi:methyl-accepting chemotaxis protein